MNDVKSFFASITIWGALAAVLGGAVNIYAALADTPLSRISIGLVGLVAAGGGLFSIYGRIKATKTIA